jgi:hypothetical protein
MVSAQQTAKSQHINRTACRQTMEKPHDLYGRFNLRQPELQSCNQRWLKLISAKSRGAVDPAFPGFLLGTVNQLLARNAVANPGNGL